MNYYNDIDPYCCEWLRNLIAAGEIPPGDVDGRSIKDVGPKDLNGYTQCHFFAGIGGWPLALRLAGWPTDVPVWTGSCPCQPYSSAGKGLTEKDPRHLWPDFFRLIQKCHPSTIIGEQVAAAIGHGWLDGVFDDLEREDYACGAVVLPACSVGAPHIRQRLFWVADATVPEHGLGQQRLLPQGGCGDGTQGVSKRTACTVYCQDGKARRVPSFESGIFPLAARIPTKLGPSLAGLRRVAKDARRNRVGRLRGYGNSIVPQVAAEFIKAYSSIVNLGRAGQGIIGQINHTV